MLIYRRCRDCFVVVAAPNLSSSRRKKKRKLPDVNKVELKIKAIGSLKKQKTAASAKSLTISALSAEEKRSVDTSILAFNMFQ